MALSAVVKPIHQLRLDLGVGDHYRYLKRTTRQRVARSCAGELEREVTEVLGCVGLDESLCRRVAVGLMKAENDVNKATQDESAVPSQRTGFIQSTLQTLARQPRTISDDTESASKLKFSDDVGLTAFLLRFGEGLEEVPNSRLFISAFTIGGAYFVGGLIPLIPYMIVKDVKHGLFWSVVVTAVVLVVFGILKAYHSESAAICCCRRKS